MANDFTFLVSGPDSVRRIIEALWKVPRGWVVIIREARRTSEQNKKMWAMLTDTARAKPQGRVMTPHKWKSVFMDAIGSKPEWVPSLDGDSVVCTGYRSSRLTKTEMSDLIECIYEYGARHDVQWSEPVERKAA